MTKTNDLVFRFREGTFKPAAESLNVTKYLRGDLRACRRSSSALSALLLFWVSLRTTLLTIGFAPDFFATGVALNETHLGWASHRATACLRVRPFFRGAMPRSRFPSLPSVPLHYVVSIVQRPRGTSVSVGMKLSLSGAKTVRPSKALAITDRTISGGHSSLGPINIAQHDSYVRPPPYDMRASCCGLRVP